MSDETDFNVSRRDAARMIAGGALGLAALRSHSAGAAPHASHSRAPASPEPGMKLGLRWRHDPSDDDLLFLKQIGATHILVTLPMGHGGGAQGVRSTTCSHCGATFTQPAGDFTQVRLPTADQLRAIKARFESGGLKVFQFMGPLMIPPKEVVLNLPGRDQAIDLYKQWIRTNAEAGMYVAGGSFMLTGVWESGKTPTRFAPTRLFDASAPVFQDGYKMDVPAFGREYSREEVIANYNYFIRQIAPVAESSGVAFIFHPDDVPVYDKLAGVPRIFNNFSEIKARLAAAESPNIGMIMCCGVWIEGGAAMGSTPEEAVRWFARNHRAWQIHFRNVSSPLPRFHEAFEDTGYYDMYKIMKATYDSGYRELIQFDHTPEMVGAPYSYPAYALGYMHALYQRAAAGSPIGRT